MQWGGPSCGIPRGAGGHVLASIPAGPGLLPQATLQGNLGMCSAQAGGSGWQQNLRLCCCCLLLRRPHLFSFCPKHVLVLCPSPACPCSMMDRDQVDYTGY